MQGHLDDELGRPPDTDDLHYHLSTLFPPVRPNGYLEVRYLDAQAGRDWHLPLLVLEALLSSDTATSAARAVVAATAHRLSDAARLGLAEPGLRAAAVALLTLAADHTPDPTSRDVLHAATTRAARGRPPGMETTHDQHRHRPPRRTDPATAGPRGPATPADLTPQTGS